MKKLWELYITFLKMGAFTFGGGYAMLPMIEREIVDEKHWATSEEVMDYFAVGQCTPGVIAVNTSTFIGYKLKGIPGAIVASLGFITPSFFIIGIIASFLNNFNELKVVQSAFWGIRVGVCVLMINSIKKMVKSGVIDWLTCLVFIITLIGMTCVVSNPILYVIVGTVVGLLFCEAVRKEGK